MAVVLLALCFVIRTSNLAFSSNNHAESLLNVLGRFKKKECNFKLVTNFQLQD